MQRRSVLVASAVVTLAGTAVDAMAESPAQSANPLAQLDEIVITAQKRTERLSDVPVSASVLSAAALTRGNVGDIADLNNVVPSVNLVGTFNGRVPMGIRGISSNANESTVGLASGVAIMVDGVPIPSDSQSGNQLEDIKSVEVLKGPQATLGGRTASAGIINIVTRGPTDQLTGDVSATATDDHEYRFNGFVGGPLMDKVLGSLSVYGNTRQFPIINEFNDDHSVQHNDGVRGKLLFKPTDALDVTLVGDYHVSVSHGSNFVYSYVTPGAHLLLGVESPTNPFPPPPIAATLSQAAVLAGVTPSTRNKFYNSPVLDSGSDIKDLNFTANVDYRVGELTLGSTTAYQHETIANLQDLFVNSSYFSNNFRDAFIALHIPAPPSTWADFNNTQYQDIDVKQTSQEFKLVSPADRKFNYLLGFFFSDQKVDLGTGRTFTPAETHYDVSSDTKTYDVYGRGTLKFTDTTSLVAGLRYNSDHLSYGYSQIGAPGASANQDSSSAVVGDISLQHKLGATMAYVTYARGYAPKVFNTGVYSGGNAVAPPHPLDATGQEHINHFEIGTKGRYWDQRLMVNASAFYTVYSNYQVQTSASVPDDPAPILELTPAGKAKTQGVELDTALAATETLRLDFSAAYIDAQFVDYKNATCWGNGVIQTLAEGCHPDPTVPGQLVQDVSGKTMPDSPRFKETLGIEQRVPLDGTNLEMTVGGTYSYRTRSQFQPDQNPQTIQSSFGLLNLSIGLREKTGKYSVTAFCNNVTNHFYAADIEDFWNGPWNSNAVVMQPARDAVRYFGVRLNAGF